jgi:2,3-dihydro-2,3-dihydroxybenzoate dehydrogenase
MSHYTEFKNKIAVVSGAAQGIGKAVADALLAAGAQVVALDVRFNAQTLSQPVAGVAHQLSVNIADTAAVNQAIVHIEQTLGTIDYVANVAGILRRGSLTELSDSDWNDTFAVNTTGTFNLCRAAAKVMIPRQRGAIVAVSSNAAQVPRINMGSYAASKAATTQLIKCFGLELAQYNIRCNIVSPGSTDTEMQRQLCPDATGVEKVIQGSLAQYRLGIPLRRIATPATIANAVMFLLSDQAAHITMENIIVDGGATLGAT